MDMVLLFIYGIPDRVSNEEVSRLQSILGGMVQGTRKLELKLNEIECFAPRERTEVISGSRIVIKIEGLKERALRKGVDAWEIAALKTALEEKVKLYINLPVCCIMK